MGKDVEIETVVEEPAVNSNSIEFEGITYDVAGFDEVRIWQTNLGNGNRGNECWLSSGGKTRVRIDLPSWDHCVAFQRACGPAFGTFHG
jgi:hypothetical protein